MGNFPENASLDPYVQRTVQFTGFTLDTYQQVICPNCVKITMQISNNPINIGFGFSQQGNAGSGLFPTLDEYYLPVLAGLARQCDIIRFKSAVAGSPAFVAITALPDVGP